MKRPSRMTKAQEVVWRISELRDLARRLARAGYQAGLHSRDPDQLPAANKVAERTGKYGTRARR